jgi:hypothetical protein
MGGPTLFGGYLPVQQLNDPFDEEGYCRSGDLFEIAGDQLQYYRYVDRAKDIIIRGGFNISRTSISWSKGRARHGKTMVIGPRAACRRRGLGRAGIGRASHREQTR